MTLKTYKTILFASLIAVMVVPFASSNLAYGFTDEYTIAWEILDKKLILVEDKITKIENKLKSENLSEKKLLKFESKLAKLQAKEARLIEKINVLEQQSIASFVVDPQTETKLLNAEKFVYDKYINTESDSYIGANPINFVVADFQDRRLLVLVDEELSQPSVNSFTDDDSTSQLENYIADITSETDLDVKVEVASFEDISCKNRLINCSPMVGGISIAKSGDGFDDDSTLAFKAKTKTGKTGFVIAGHAGNVGDKVYQRANGNYAGKIILESNNRECDCAFVESSRLMSNGIWKNHRSSYTINDYAITSDFTSGTFLKKSGIKTGVTYGDLITSGGYKTSLIKMRSDVGDSGSPVFKSSGSDAELFGMIRSNSGTVYSIMEPYPVIKTNLNLR